MAQAQTSHDLQLPARSRLGRRVAAFRQSLQTNKVPLPETPLVVAGALGGPFVIFVFTPLRNALTLAAKNTESSAGELYARVFQGGLQAGWTGGLVPVLPSCPQFCMMGPLFHLFRQSFNSVVLAVICSAILETCISYGSQTLNAQLAYNEEQLQAGSGLQVPLCNPMIPYGPGFLVHIMRNFVAMSGIRILSGPCQAGLTKVFNMAGLGGSSENIRKFFVTFWPPAHLQCSAHL